MSKQLKRRRVRLIDTDLSRSEVEYWIEQYCFDEKARKILIRHWLDGITFEALAEEFDMSVRGIKYLVYREGDRVLAHIPFNS